MNIKKVMSILRRGNKKHCRIATIGMFDGVHRGHRFLIDFLKAEGERRGLTPTVVTFADHPLSVVRPSECPRLITSVDDKIQLLEASGITDCILLPFNDRLRRQSAKTFLKRLKDSYAVEVLVIGFNHSFGHDHVKGIDAYRTIGSEVGIEVIAAPEYTATDSHISSSIIRQYLTSGNLEAANRDLGHLFALSGRVVEGNRIGRTLGYPTANIEPDSNRQLIPCPGVYAACVVTENGERHDAMVNIGHRPTIDPDDQKTHIEVYIFDFLGYLYGEKLSLELVTRIRPEKKFSSLDKLKSQLATDEQAIRKFFAAYHSH